MHFPTGVGANDNRQTPEERLGNIKSMDIFKGYMCD